MPNELCGMPNFTYSLHTYLLFTESWPPKGLHNVYVYWILILTLKEIQSTYPYLAYIENLFKHEHQYDWAHHNCPLFTVHLTMFTWDVYVYISPLPLPFWSGNITILSTKTKYKISCGLLKYFIRNRNSLLIPGHLLISNVDVRPNLNNR